MSELPFGDLFENQIMNDNDTFIQNGHETNVIDVST